MIEDKNLIRVGVISSVHGIQGHVIVKSFTNPVTNIIKMRLVSKIGENVTLKLIRQNPLGDLICKFNEINSRTEAEKFKGHSFFCQRSNLPPLLDEDEFYIEDLKGLAVLDQNLNPLGKINNLFNFGAGDIIEIEFADHEIVLFPFTKDFFPIVTKNHVILNRNL